MWHHDWCGFLPCFSKLRPHRLVSLYLTGILQKQQTLKAVKPSRFCSSRETYFWPQKWQEWQTVWWFSTGFTLHFLKLTASLPLKIGWAPKGNDRKKPSIFRWRLLLVSGRLNGKDPDVKVYFLVGNLNPSTSFNRNPVFLQSKMAFWSTTKRAFFVISLVFQIPAQKVFWVCSWGPNTSKVSKEAVWVSLKTIKKKRISFSKVFHWSF